MRRATNRPPLRLMTEAAAAPLPLEGPERVIDVPFDVPHLDIRAGDRLVIRPEARIPVFLARPLTIDHLAHLMARGLSC